MEKLVDILEELVDYYQGFEELGNQINIRCFTHDPSIGSSLKVSPELHGPEPKWKAFIYMS